MGNIKMSYPLAMGKPNTHPLYNHFELIKNEKFEEGTLLGSTREWLDPYHYHASKCGKKSV